MLTVSVQKFVSGQYIIVQNQLFEYKVFFMGILERNPFLLNEIWCLNFIIDLETNRIQMVTNQSKTVNTIKFRHSTSVRDLFLCVHKPIRMIKINFDLLDAMAHQIVGAHTQINLWGCIAKVNFF